MSVRGASPRVRGYQDAVAGRDKVQGLLATAEADRPRYADGYQAGLARRAEPAVPAYDPLPDLAALLDGLHEAARQGNTDGLLWVVRDLLAGPYGRLRGGLLLDEPGREDIGTEAAVREALAAYITPRGRPLYRANPDIRTNIAQVERDLREHDRLHRRAGEVPS